MTQNSVSAKKNNHIVIIGNGIAGVSCARYIRKNSDHKITIIFDETEEFFSRTALMYIFMGHMKYEHTKPYESTFWSKNRINLLKGLVTEIVTANNMIRMEDGRSVEYDKLVIASGSKYNTFGWKGENLIGVTDFIIYITWKDWKHLLKMPEMQ